VRDRWSSAPPHPPGAFRSAINLRDRYTGNSGSPAALLQEIAR
jgi:hypothetical protein